MNLYNTSEHRCKIDGMIYYECHGNFSLWVTDSKSLVLAYKPPKHHYRVVKVLGQRPGVSLKVFISASKDLVNLCSSGTVRLCSASSVRGQFGELCTQGKILSEFSLIKSPVATTEENKLCGDLLNLL